MSKLSKPLGFIEAEQIFHGISFFDRCLFFPFGKLKTLEANADLFSIFDLAI